MNWKRRVCLAISGIIMVVGISISSFAETYDVAKNITVGESMATFDLSESMFNEAEQASLRGAIHSLYDETVLGRSLIEVGNEIQAYIYEEGEISEYIVDYYPIYVNGQVDSIFSIDEPGEHACYGIDQDFAMELDQFLSKEGDGVLIWAGNRLFAKNGRSVSIVLDMSKVLDLETYTEEEIADLSLQQPKEERQKFIVSGKNMGEKKQISNIYKIQQPSSTTCWAATMACIIHNQTGTKYTVQNIIDKVGINPTVGVSTDDMTVLLSDYYRIKGTFVYECPTDLTVRAEIDSNVAFFGGWEEIDGLKAHATAICGYDDTASLMYIYFMDPWTGTVKNRQAVSYMDYRLSYGSTRYKLTNHTRFPVM